VFRCHNAAYTDCFVCLDKLIKFFFSRLFATGFHSGEINISIKDFKPELELAYTLTV